MSAATTPSLLASRDYQLFWIGSVAASTGVQAVLAANLWQVQELTNSTLQVGIIGLIRAGVEIVVGPFGGSVADRWNRRWLVQAGQLASLLVNLALSVLTFSGLASALHIYAAVFLTSIVLSSDGAARNALIPAVVGRDRVIEAISILIPGRKMASLLGPATAGVLIGIFGSGSVYVFGAATAATLILAFALTRFSAGDAVRVKPTTSIIGSIVEGFAYVRSRALIWQLLVMDFGPNLFLGYQVLLPSLARDVFHVGPTGYGFLAAAPAIGAIVGAGFTYRIRAARRKGRLVIGLTAAFAAFGIALGCAPIFAAAVLIVALLGFTDSAAQTIRQTVSLAEVPDELRGRVSSVYSMTQRTGPAVGETILGAAALSLGTPLALVVGGTAGLVWVVALARAATTLRRYDGW